MEATSDDDSNSIFTQKLNEWQQAKTTATKKTPHIWTQIAQAEEVEEVAHQFDVVSMVDTFSIMRGSETYMVGPRRKRKCPVATPEDGEILEAEKKQKEEDADYESDSSISSGGLSDDSKLDLKERYAARRASSRKPFKRARRRQPAGEAGEAIKMTTDEKDNQTLETETEQKPLELETVSKQKTVSRILQEEKMAEMLDYKVAFYIANKLKEHKKLLFSQTIKLLGREKTIELFFKTLKIERLGGMMIKNKTRRRTPGGVFLYLVRNDARLPKLVVDEIFKSERDARKVEKGKCSKTNTNKFWDKIVKKVNKGGGALEKDVDSDMEEDDTKNSYDVPMKKQKPETPSQPAAIPFFPITKAAAAVATTTGQSGLGGIIPGQKQPIFYGDIDDGYLDLTAIEPPDYDF